MADYGTGTQAAADSKAAPRSQVLRERLVEHTREIGLLADRVEKAAARLLGSPQESAARNPNMPSTEPPSPLANNHADQLNVELNRLERLHQRIFTAIGRIEEFV